VTAPKTIGPLSVRGRIVIVVDDGLVSYQRFRMFGMIMPA
jgi:hypothetical protein